MMAKGQLHQMRGAGSRAVSGVSFSTRSVTTLLPEYSPTRDSTRMAAVTAEPPALIHTDPSDSDRYGLDA